MSNRTYAVSHIEVDHTEFVPRLTVHRVYRYKIRAVAVRKYNALRKQILITPRKAAESKRVDMKVEVRRGTRSVAVWCGYERVGMRPDHQRLPNTAERWHQHIISIK